MNRLVIIMLCVCGAVVCAFLAYLGYQQQLAEQKTADAPPPEFTCKSLLESIPQDTYTFTLIDFQPGKHFFPEDLDDDGVWDRVIVPVFPSELKKLGRNYRAILLVVADTPNKDAFFEKINSPRIEANYWFTSQKLDANAYNRLAEKYSSMDFARSLVLHSGFPKSNSSFGKILLWAAMTGFGLSLSILGWQSLRLLISGIRSESQDDDDDEERITNRAGLPTKLDQALESQRLMRE